MNVIITGGSKGLGKAMAMKFAKEGHSLMLCARSADTLKATQNEIQSLFPNITVHVFCADLSLKEQVLEFGNFCLEKGSPDILINNAGSYTQGNCADGSPDLMHSMMDVNFYSAFYLSQFLIPKMKALKKGHIFNICSIASQKAYANGGCYSVSKFALYGFSQNLRLELKDHGIKVTSVLPGAVFTDSWSGFDNSNNRIMNPEDIANMVFAASQLSQQAVVEEIVLRPILGDL
jgi:short-subunit dehydrogenase